MAVMDTVPCQVQHNYCASTEDSHRVCQLRHRLACCLMNMLHLAHKVQVAVPPSQLEQPSPATVQTTPQQSSGTPFPRRYSTPQGEEGEDTFDTDSILGRFSTSVALHNRLKGHNLYEPSEDGEWSSIADKSFGQKSLSKCLSASDVYNRSSSEVPDSSQPSMGFMSRYLQRRGSTGSVLARVPPEALGQAAQTSKDDTSLVVASQKAGALAQRPTASLDVTDGSSSSIDPPGAGGRFGLLARTRQFGAWLTKATEGESVDVTRKDINVVAPSSF